VTWILPVTFIALRATSERGSTEEHGQNTDNLRKERAGGVYNPLILVVSRLGLEPRALALKAPALLRNIN